MITLQFQGSALADDAQFSLGETRFAREEFLLASFEYQQLVRNMSASPLVPDARFKIGVCYYRLSPKSLLDQQYTTRAIDALQSFVEYHPAHASVPEAETLIRELTARLAKKAYEIAGQYATLEYYRASLFYYDEVLEKYHDTEYAPLAALGKTEVLVARRRYEEAQRALASFFEKYPNSGEKERAERLRRLINENIPAGRSWKDVP